LVAHRVLAIFRRRLFTCLTILSLLLCLATVALWVRSYWRQDNLERVRGTPEMLHYVNLGSAFAELSLLAVQVIKTPTPPIMAEHDWHYSADRATVTDTLSSWANLKQLGPGTFRFRGFGYISISSHEYSVRGIYFPHWFAALLLIILPAIRLRSILRTRRRHRAGLCPHCGYDLRATPDRCPECGHLPSVSSFLARPSSKSPS
jgi:hypothetical protein